MNPNPEYTKQLAKQSTSSVEDTWDSTKEKDSKIANPKEFAAAAAHSDKFNIVVEGKTDVKVYEQLIASIGVREIDCYYAQNREELFKVYLEIKDKCLLSRVAFIADQDSWVFLKEKPPEGYNKIYMEDIIWTEGYSIENDLYIKGNLKKLVREEYEEDYKKTVKSICTWYAFQVNLNSTNLAKGIDVRSLRDIVPHHCVDLAEKLRKEISDAKVEISSLKEQRKDIENEYEKLIQGKTLFDLLARFLNRCGFAVKYGTKSFDLLVRIAITFSPTWSSSFKTKLEYKLPDLKNLKKKSLGAANEKKKSLNELLARHHHEGAVNTIKELIKENSDYNKEVGGDLELGCALERLSQYKAAIKFIKKAIKTNPKDPRAYTTLSKCYLEENMIEEAKDTLAQLEQILMETSRSNA